MVNTMTPQDIEKLSFEDALEALENIVNALEQDSVPLEDAIAKYELGSALKTHCDTMLQSAQDKIEKIHISQTGEASTVPLDNNSAESVL